MRRRTDENARDQYQADLPRSPYIILDDVRSLKEAVEEGTNGTQGRRTTPPESPKDDRIGIELVAAVNPLPAPPTKPARPSRKRKRPSRVVEEVGTPDGEGAGDEDRWR
ncbi:hypothetical protein LTR49_028203 [Elasticomyces elasticus]|nr:hypothetical protein LTR49_028203 [Elasticomyces elasticus]